MGGLFHVDLQFARLDPFPYRVGLLIVLTANTLLAYQAAKLLVLSPDRFADSASQLFHVAQFVLYYNTSQLYDVLCFFFWFCAFNYYITKRLRGNALGIGQIAILLVLYICALNSKEMAVTLPVLLIAFELVYFQTRQWKKALLPISLVGLATLAYVVGKSIGPEALSRDQAYKPVITFGRFLDSNSHYAAKLFYVNSPDIGKARILALWSALAYLAARSRKRYLWWALALVVFGATPVAFISGRGAGCLNIPAFGYSLPCRCSTVWFDGWQGSHSSAGCTVPRHWLEVSS
ncbi:MAG: hypothetical protein WKF37_19390 [Bryobacteraceae bacterium]